MKIDIKTGIKYKVMTPANKSFHRIKFASLRYANFPGELCVKARYMKTTIKLMLVFGFFSLASCHTLFDYKPGYQRVAFDTWVTKSFEKIGVEVKLPIGYKLDYDTDNWLRFLLHVYYPDSMMVEYTATYYISITKFTPDQYLHSKYNRKNITSPYFYKEAKYFNTKERNDRLRTENVHQLIKHQKDRDGNIYVTEVRIYPWPNEPQNIEEDITFGYTIINSVKLL